MPFLTAGHYIAIAGDRAALHLLDESAVKTYMDRMIQAPNWTCRAQAEDVARKQAFGPGVTAALPAGRVDCLEWLIEHYDGSAREDVRGIAACLLTGTPVLQRGSKDDTDGGIRVMSESPLPVQPPPAAIAG